MNIESFRKEYEVELDNIVDGQLEYLYSKWMKQTIHTDEDIEKAFQIIEYYITVLENEGEKIMDVESYPPIVAESFCSVLKKIYEVRDRNRNIKFIKNRFYQAINIDTYKNYFSSQDKRLTFPFGDYIPPHSYRTALGAKIIDHSESVETVREYFRYIKEALDGEAVEVYIPTYCAEIERCDLDNSGAPRSLANLISKSYSESKAYLAPKHIQDLENATLIFAAMFTVGILFLMLGTIPKYSLFQYPSAFMLLASFAIPVPSLVNSVKNGLTKKLQLLIDRYNYMLIGILPTYMLVMAYAIDTKIDYYYHISFEYQSFILYKSPAYINILKGVERGFNLLIGVLMVGLVVAILNGFTIHGLKSNVDYRLSLHDKIGK